MSDIRSLLGRGRDLPKATVRITAPDGGSVPIEFQALSRLESERLYAEHMDEDGGLGKGFTPALAAACSTGDLTVDEWTALLDNDLTPGEALAVQVILHNLNNQTPEVSLGKG